MTPNRLTAVALCLMGVGGLWAKSALDEKPPTASTKPADPTKKPPAPPVQAAEKFHTIVLGGSGNVVVRQTGKEAVMPSDPLTGEPLIKEGVLHLNGASDFEVEVKELRGLKLNGSGNAAVKDLKGKNLEVAATGSGNVTATGTVDELDVQVSGSGNLEGVALKAKRAVVKASGSGTAVVNASEKVAAEVSGSGSVEYIGSPMVEQSVTGSGEVRQHVPK
jgi:hypothetical protein